MKASRALLLLSWIAAALLPTMAVINIPLISKAWAQGAGPIGRPPLGGNLPQDLDTLSPALTSGTVQTQTGATLCNSTICYVTTNATSGNGLRLRQCTLAPMRQLVVNATANPLQVYGGGTDTINGVATGTGVSVPAATSTIQTGVVEFVCVAGGTAASWYTH